MFPFKMCSYIIIILVYQSLLISVYKEGSGKRLSITLVPFTGLVLLLGSGESLKN